MIDTLISKNSAKLRLRTAPDLPEGFSREMD